MTKNYIHEIERDELVGLAQSLMRFPNVNPPGDDHEIAQFLVEYLGEMGMDVNSDDVGDGHRNVVATWSGEEPGPVLLLNGHYDVVEPGQGWTVDPYGSTIKDGYLIGRGAVDMKAGIAALIVAVKSLKTSGFPLKGTIIMAFVADEEIGQLGSQTLAKQGVSADFALVAEPSSLIPVIAQRGRRIYEISASGKTAHAALPEQGINAIAPMLDYLQAILRKADAFSQKVHPRLGRTKFTLTTIQGGSAINSVPDRCKATVDFRHLPNHEPDEIDEEIQGIMEAVALKFPETGLGWKVLFSSPSFDCAEDMPLVRALRQATEGLFGFDPGVKGYEATTDAGVLSTVMGIPTVVCGPGDLRQAHQPDEKIEIAELLRGAEIYARMIQDVMHA
jgi:acetylornithine deacetylase/succinyl-diaminopimelate desuccinylase family protein